MSFFPTVSWNLILRFPARFLHVFLFDPDDVRRSPYTSDSFLLLTFSHQTVSYFHLVPCTLAARCHDYAAILMPYYPRDMIELCGRKDPRRVSLYMSHVARAVEKLHRHRFAHNDIKLENVFLDGSDRAILGDLGLAMEVKDSTGTLDAGLVGGTRDYWPPEKSEGHTRIDPFKVRFFPFFVLQSTVSPFEMFINKHYLLQ